MNPEPFSSAAAPVNPGRRRFARHLAAASVGVAAPAILVGNAWARNKSIRVGTYNGAMAEFVRTQVIPKFEADYGCRVYQTEGFTLGNIAILRQQKANPQYSVMMMDDAGIPIARAEDLIEKLPADQIRNLANVLPRYLLGDGYGAAFSISICSPFYNTERVKSFESFAELWAPRYKGQVLMVSPKQGTSLMPLIAAAAVATGKPLAQAQYELDRGFEQIAKLKDNILTIYDNNVTAVLQVAQGEALVGATEFSKYIAPYTLKGASVAQSVPKEGVFGGVNGITLVKNGPEPALGAAFIDRILDVSVQKGMAETIYAAPSVRDVSLSPAIAPRLAYPEKRIEELRVFMIDWAYINPRRSQIVERLNKIFGT